MTIEAILIWAFVGLVAGWLASAVVGGGYGVVGDIIVGIVGEDRIALGTDYPFPLGEAVPGATIEALTELPEASRQRMLTGTAEAFLGRSAVPLA